MILKGFLNWIWYYSYKPYRNKRKELASERIKICEACKHFWKYSRQCSLCWCFMDIKTKMYFDLDKNGKSISGCLDKRW